MKHYYRTLTIAGSDSGGGAGIQADLKTFAALGCYGMSAITALTAQNTQGVKSIHPVSPEFVMEQINVIVDDIGVDAIKIGMLFNPAIITAVAAALKPLSNVPIVLDPVMVATSGDTLLQEDAINALQQQLFPLATLITPNIAEAKMLLQQNIGDQTEMETAARGLAQMGANAALVKGGHLLGTETADCLFTRDDSQLQWFKTARVKTQNTHGTGCTLSSAITAYLAKGSALPDAVAKAKTYITAAITGGSEYDIGQGSGPVHHFYEIWTD